MTGIKEKSSAYLCGSGCHVFRKIDDERFDSIGHLTYTDHTPGFLLDVWKYFYAFTFLLPFENITWESYINRAKTKGIDDIDGKKILSDGLAGFYPD